MNFDAAALEAAFATTAALGDAVTDPAPAEDLASKEVQAVAADLGLDRDDANALMGACLRAAHEGPETDPQKIRRIPECSIIAVGMAFGVLAQMRAATTPEAIERAAQRLFLDARASTAMPGPARPSADENGELPDGWWEQVQESIKTVYRRDAQIALLGAAS